MLWYRFFDSLLFWQAIWFLFFQQTLSGAEAIVLYAVYDIATTLIEVPSGYFSDRVGRRTTLILSALCGALGCLALASGQSYLAFAFGQILLGASTAFRSGTDTSLLYESLAAAGRTEEAEVQEMRLMRFSLIGFAIAAITGGALAMWSSVLPFYATAIAFGAALCMAARMVEPSKHRTEMRNDGSALHTLRSALAEPVLTWLFVLAVLMYVFSHLPFVFGQPFIREALDGIGLAREAPAVSGAVTGAMMLVSVLVSLIAVSVRMSLGLSATLLFAFALQIALVVTLASSTSVAAIAVLLLRMAPDALAGPFIRARIQPLLASGSRATYLSLQSLAGKLLLALTLIVASTGAQTAGLLPAAELQRILMWYSLAGAAGLATLGVFARRLMIDPASKAPLR